MDERVNVNAVAGCFCIPRLFKVGLTIENDALTEEHKSLMTASLGSLLEGNSYGELTLLSSGLDNIDLCTRHSSGLDDIDRYTRQSHTSGPNEPQTIGLRDGTDVDLQAIATNKPPRINTAAHERDLLIHLSDTTDTQYEDRTPPTDQNVVGVSFKYGEIYRNRMQYFNIGLKLAVFLRDVALGESSSKDIESYCQYEISCQEFSKRPDITLVQQWRKAVDKRIKIVNSVLRHTKLQTLCWVNPTSRISYEQFSTGAFEVLYGKGITQSDEYNPFVDRDIEITEYVVSRDVMDVYIVVGLRTSVGDVRSLDGDHIKLQVVGVLRTIPLPEYIVHVNAHEGQWTTYATLQRATNRIDLNICGSWKLDQEKISIAGVKVIYPNNDCKNINIGNCIGDLIGKKRGSNNSLVAAPAQVFAMAMSRIGMSSTISLTFSTVETAYGSRYIGHLDVDCPEDMNRTQVLETTVYEVSARDSSKRMVIWGAGHLKDPPPKINSMWKHLCGSAREQDDKHTRGNTCEKLYSSISPYIKSQDSKIPCSLKCSLACAIGTGDKWYIKLSNFEQLRRHASVNSEVKVTRFPKIGEIALADKPIAVPISGYSNAMRTLKKKAQELTFSFGVNASLHGAGNSIFSFGGQAGAVGAAANYAKVKVLKKTSHILKLVRENLETCPQLKVCWCMKTDRYEEELSTLIRSMFDNSLTDGSDPYCDFALYVVSNGDMDGTLYCYKWYQDDCENTGILTPDKGFTSNIHLKIVVDKVPSILPFVQTSSGKYCYSRQTKHVVHVAGLEEGNKTLPRLVKAALREEARLPHEAFAPYLNHSIGKPQRHDFQDN